MNQCRNDLPEFVSSNKSKWREMLTGWTPNFDKVAEIWMVLVPSVYKSSTSITLNIFFFSEEETFLIYRCICLHASKHFSPNWFRGTVSKDKSRNNRRVDKTKKVYDYRTIWMYISRITEFTIWIIPTWCHLLMSTLYL